MVSYFRPNDLKTCIDSILTNTVEPFQLTIIDNSCGAIDTTLKSFKDPRITVLHNETNLGKGRAFMHWYPEIIKNDKNEFFVSIDPDLIVPQNWLSKMLRAAYSVPAPGVFAPVLIQKKGDTFTKQQARGKLVMHKKDKESAFVKPSLYRNRHTAGPLFLISRKLFNKIGGYAQTQLYGNDDGELCKAAYKRGCFVGIVTDVEVLHLENDVTQEYKDWKKRNINKDVDQRGFWDQA